MLYSSKQIYRSVQVISGHTVVDIGRKIDIFVFPGGTFCDSMVLKIQMFLAFTVISVAYMSFNTPHNSIIPLLLSGYTTFWDHRIVIYRFLAEVRGDEKDKNVLYGYFRWSKWYIYLQTPPLTWVLRFF